MSREYDARVLALAPSAYWKCGEASGDLADSSGSGLTAADAGTPGYGAVGPIADSPITAVTLPGDSGSYFTAGYLAGTPDTFTIIVWFKKAANGTYMELVGRAANGFGFRSSNANLLQLEKNGVATIVESTKAVTDLTSWHMGAATKAGATVRLYMDGSDVTGVVTNQTITEPASHIVRIGGNLADPANGPWNGALGRIELHDGVALTAAQISGLWHSGIEHVPPIVKTYAVWREPQPPFSALFQTELGASLVKFEVSGMGTASILVPRSDPNNAKMAALLARCVPMVTVERSDETLPFAGFPLTPTSRAKDPSGAIQLADATWRLSRAKASITEEIRTASGTIILEELAEMERSADPRLYLNTRYVGGGPPASLARSAQKGDSLLRELEKQTGYEAFLSHRVTPAGVVTFLRWEEMQGVDRRLERWDEGTHLADVGYAFDNTKGATSSTTVGGTGALTGRPSEKATASKGRGIGGSVVEFVQGVTDPEILSARSARVLTMPANASVKWDGELVESAIDMTRLSAGDIHTLHSETAYFGTAVQGVARLIGLELDGAAGVHRFVAVGVS